MLIGFFFGYNFVHTFRCLWEDYNSGNTTHLGSFEGQKDRCIPPGTFLPRGLYAEMVMAVHTDQTAAVKQKFFFYEGIYVGIVIGGSFAIGKITQKNAHESRANMFFRGLGYWILLELVFFFMPFMCYKYCLSWMCSSRQSSGALRLAEQTKEKLLKRAKEANDDTEFERIRKMDPIKVMQEDLEAAKTDDTVLV
jgi:hypothetical protein